MADIKLSSLHPAGAALFFGSEDLTHSVRDLSEEELKIRGGSKGSGKSFSKKSFSSSFKKKPYPYYY